MAERSGSETSWRWTLGWFLVAAALRLPSLGRFSLWGDEIYSFEDALELFTPATTAGDYAFPIFYLLERLVLELTGLADAAIPDPGALQWALRIVPALAGAAAAAAAYACSRGFLERRERHLLAALIAFSPWLVFFSQWARFYTLLLALSIPATFELLRAARDGSAKRGVIASAWLIAATLVHPTALLLLGGHCAASVIAAVMRLRPLNRGHVPPLLLPVALALPVLIWPDTMKPLLFKWGHRDAGVESIGALVLGIGFNVGPVIGALAVLGLPSLWRRDRTLTVHVVAGVGVPVLFLIGLAGFGRSVEQRYLLSLLPLALIPAATYTVELAELVHGRSGAPRWAVPTLALLGYLPGLVSNWIDGDRHDLAGAAAVVRERLQKGPDGAITDGVIAETNGLFRHYLPPDFPENHLLEAPPDRGDERAQLNTMWKDCPRIWVVVHAEMEWMSPPHPAFHEWAWTEGHLIQELWRPRFDYHQNRIRVFLVDTRTARKFTR